mmetsp:Transcript_39170/g.37540  ORF Transcript_39170/g.37540 Transcript_39170/m.37540 type:complete len:98 (+) Transcript_39170:538-831(+)
MSFLFSFRFFFDKELISEDLVSEPLLQVLVVLVELLEELEELVLGVTALAPLNEILPIILPQQLNQLDLLILVLYLPEDLGVLEGRVRHRRRSVHLI